MRVAAYGSIYSLPRCARARCCKFNAVSVHVKRCQGKDLPSPQLPLMCADLFLLLCICPCYSAHCCLVLNRTVRSSAQAASEARGSDLDQRQNCTTAVVVVDHGSRRDASNRMLQDFVALYRYELVMVSKRRMQMPNKKVTMTHADVSSSGVRPAGRWLNQLTWKLLNQQ